ncbi:MAG: ribbon-helix-helix protein, CopG family [Aeromicrobium sp.]|jgi:metal-responsive CopG/Arc/MetJ family transcriptional regulator|nr:ribbon-helix-helix protein, CopG family [Aeromicrobium sp.]
MPRTARTIGFSVPPELADEVERLAAEEGRTKSELFREMVRVYKRDREMAVFEDLAAYGRARARARGICDEADVERLIHEARGA